MKPKKTMLILPEKCKWIFDVDTGHYDTACARAFIFNDGEVKGNGFRFCPFCGKKNEVGKHG